MTHSSIYAIIFTAFAFAGCCAFYPNPPSTSTQSLQIEIDSSSFSISSPSTFRIHVSLTNHSDTKVAYIHNSWISTNPYRYWYAKVVYNDTSILIKRDEVVDKLRGLSSDDYSIIEPNATYRFDYVLSLDECAMDLESIFKNEPTAVSEGKYSIRIYYNDISPRHCRAVTGCIQSNELKFNYKTK
jgi:hypothetical protein